MFEKVLVCLDGSPLAEQILPYVLAESDCWGKVIMLKVLTPPEATLPLGVPGAPGVPVHTESMLERFMKELEEAPAYLEEKAQPLRKKGLDVECVVRQGRPGETIVNYAKDNKVKLIAIATHGHSGLRQITIGSTAEFVLRNSGLPLLLVTPKKQRKA